MWTNCIVDRGHVEDGDSIVLHVQGAKGMFLFHFFINVFPAGKCCFFLNHCTQAAWRFCCCKVAREPGAMTTAHSSELILRTLERLMKVWMHSSSGPCFLGHVVLPPLLQNGH